VWRLSRNYNQFSDKTTFTTIWEHKRGGCWRGRIRYDEDGKIAYIVATDIRKIDPRSRLILEAVKTGKSRTGGLFRC